MKTPILKMTNIIKEFPGVKALDGVNLELYEGKVMALMGENGAGKSTLMKILSGVYKKDGGQIFYNGVEEDIKGPKDATKKGIAIIHQELNLIKDLSIGENIFLGREFKKGFRVDFNKLHEEGDKLLKKLNVNRSSRDLVEKLSLGEQQMVEIAKALSLDAKIIIMDEPTDALTETETQSLFKVIEELKSEGKAIVYTSHRLKEIFEVCDYITVLRDGKYVGTEDLANLDEDKMIEMMVGRKLTDQFPRVEITPGKTILKVENLNNEYVSNINFEVRAGEVVGIAGLMGAGRSELAKTIYGHFKKESGKIILNGKELNHKSAQEGLLHRIAYVSEDRKGDGLLVDLSVRENMTLSSLNRISKGLIIDKKHENERVDSYIERINIKTPSKEQLIRNLSGGNQQKVAIAKALMIHPEVLILDESTSALDVSIQKNIIDLINKIQKERNLTIGFVCHDIALVTETSHTVAVMYLGNIVEILPGHKLSKLAMHPYTKALMSAVFDLNMDFSQPIEEINNDISNKIDNINACPFRDRCDCAIELCSRRMPGLKKVSEGHYVACHLDFTV